MPESRGHQFVLELFLMLRFCLRLRWQLRRSCQLAIVLSTLFSLYGFAHVSLLSPLSAPLGAQGIPQPVFYKGKPEKILELRSIEGVLVVEEMVRGLNEPHSAAWMPMRVVTKEFADPYNQFSGYIWIISERKGALWVLYKETLYPLQGLPSDVARKGQGGFFSVHYSHWMGRIFLTYSRKVSLRLSTLVVMSYALRYYDDTFTLIDGVDMFAARPPIQTAYGYGGGLSSDQEYLFVGLGDGGNAEAAQDPKTPWGSVLRFALRQQSAGKQSAKKQSASRQVPSETSSALSGFGTFGASGKAQLFSIGHGNVESLFRDGRNRLWSVEQLRNRYGRNYGDELNLLAQGRNYEWGTPQSIRDSTLGFEFSEQEQAPAPRPRAASLGRVESPAIKWTGGLSSVFVVAAAPVTGRNLFHAWQGDFLLSAVEGQSLYRFLYREDATREQGFRLEYREQLFHTYLGPLRWIGQGFDGAIYLLSLRRGSGNGRMLRVSPKSQQYPR